MARGSWFNVGVDPLPPCTSDKQCDRVAIAKAGGAERFVNQRVLDVGPCYGTEAVEWSDVAKLYVAFDYDELVVEWTRRRAPKSAGLVATIHQLPFRDHTFDTVLDLGSFDNTGDPASAYREACRVLVPGGMLITTYGNADILGPGNHAISEDYTKPDDLAALLQQNEMTIAYRGEENQARAIMIARRNNDA